MTDRSPNPGGTASPIRAAKAEDLAQHLQSSGGDDDLSGIHEEMGERGLSRADVDQAIDDLAAAGRLRLKNLPDGISLKLTNTAVICERCAEPIDVADPHALCGDHAENLRELVSEERARGAVLLDLILDADRGIRTWPEVVALARERVPA